jgi:hypothetical protein
MFWMDPDEKPDLNADLSGAFFFATDGSVKFGEGGCASVSPQFVAGWERHKSGKYFFKRSRWRRIGDEPLAISPQWNSWLSSRFWKTAHPTISSS